MGAVSRPLATLLRAIVVGAAVYAAARPGEAGGRRGEGGGGQLVRGAPVAAARSCPRPPCGHWRRTVAGCGGG